MNRILGVLLLGVAAVAVSACVGEPLVCGQSPVPTERKLKFSTDANGCVVAVKKDDGSDGNNLEVCRGDTVKWKVKVDKTNGDKKKAVAFTGDSPFSWNDSSYQEDTIDGTVRPDAADKSYKYSVKTEGGPNNGCPLDPMIIVRP
jgi:hypothetical protein